MSIQTRPELSQSPKRIVVKIGSNGITNENGIDCKVLQSLTQDIHRFSTNGCQIILVSSGAIQMARAILKHPTNGDIDSLQALSAFGQPRLMSAYEAAFTELGLHCAQVLLTHEDLGSRRRNLNLRNTLLRLLANGMIPIVNENDSVSYSEITVGDNDQLAAMVAESIAADLLILLTGPDGLYNRDPSDPEAMVIQQIHASDDFRKVITRGQSAAGRGGMKTKLEAVRRVTPLGIPVIISSYKKPAPIASALTGGGSFFFATDQGNTSQRQRWLVSSVKAGAKIRIDTGARDALWRGASLLASGITSLAGPFRRGDGVSLIHNNRVIAYGLSEYSFKELEKIKGKNSQEIKSLLGRVPSKVVIHRNNLVLQPKD